MIIGGAKRRVHLFLSLVISPLTTHPFRDEGPFQLLIEEPTFGGGEREEIQERSEQIHVTCCKGFGRLQVVS